MEIHRLTSSSPPARFKAIARIHMAEIHLGVLPLLGVGFLARMYRGIAASPTGGVWAAMEGTEVLGFLAGSADTSATYRHVLLRGLMPLSLAAITRIVRHPGLLVKIASLAGYVLRPGRGDDQPRQEAVRAELLAIAVSASAHQRGIGRSLVQSLERDLLQPCAARAYYVSTNIEDPVSNRFYLSVGFEPWSTTPFHDLVIQQYRKTIQPEPAAGEVASPGGGRSDHE